MSVAAEILVDSAGPVPDAKTPFGASSVPNVSHLRTAATKSGKAIQMPIDVLLNSAAKACRSLRSGKGKAPGGLAEARGLGVAVKGVQKPVGLPKRITRATTVVA